MSRLHELREYLSGDPLAGINLGDEALKELLAEIGDTIRRAELIALRAAMRICDDQVSKYQSWMDDAAQSIYFEEWKAQLSAADKCAQKIECLIIARESKLGAVSTEDKGGHGGPTELSESATPLEVE